MRESGVPACRFPDDYSIAELHAIANKALPEGDDYSRSLLREQLLEEEFRSSQASIR